MIPNKGMERKIAEVLGNYCLCDNPGIMINKYYDREPNCDKCNNPLRLYWSTSLDTARELEITDNLYHRRKFNRSLTTICGGSLKVIFYTSQQWCEAWLLYKGHRWVDCAECNGGGGFA